MRRDCADDLSPVASTSEPHGVASIIYMVQESVNFEGSSVLAECQDGLGEVYHLLRHCLRAA